MAAPKRLVPVTPAARQASRTIRRIAIVAIAAIGLGLVMQGLLVLVRVLAGGPLPGTEVLAELSGTVSWSVLVCTGVAVGTSLGKARAVLAGLFGLVFAPLGLAAAKASQKVVAAAVLATGSGDAVLSLEVVSIVRALEYGLLAFGLAIFAERAVTRPGPYLRLGGGLGVLFGGFLAGLTIFVDSLDGTGRPWPLIVSTLISEVGFPIGCSLLIYLGQVATHSYREVEQGSMPAATA